MNRIVVGYDGSPAARAALDWVADRARREESRVELVSVTNMLLSDDAKTEQLLEEAMERLEEEAPGIRVEAHHLDGTMPGALVEDARGADLLVIGVHQSHPLRSALTGWLPARVGAKAHGPACIVPEGWTASDLPVTVGVDDDDSSDTALMAAAAEAAAASVPLRIVHGWLMPVPTIEGAVALLASPIEVKAAHRTILTEAGERVAQAYPDLELEEVLVPENPAGALLSRTDDSSLLVIGTHRRGIIAGAALGSVAQDVLWQSACPVLIVPKVDQPAETGESDATS